MNNLIQFLQTKKGKQIATVLGIGVLLLTGIHTYYRIKITRMQIEDLEEQDLKK